MCEINLPLLEMCLFVYISRVRDDDRTYRCYPECIGSKQVENIPRVNFLLGRRAVGFLSSWFLGLPDSLNCKVASNSSSVEIHQLYGTITFFLSEFFVKYEFKYSHKEIAFCF